MSSRPAAAATTLAGIVGGAHEPDPPVAGGAVTPLALHDRLDPRLYSRFDDWRLDLLYIRLHTRLHARLNDRLYDRINDRLSARLDTRLDARLYDRLREVR